MRLKRDASISGHPDCNSWAPLLIARPSGRVAQLLPNHPGWDKLFGQVLERVGSVSTITDDAGTLPWRFAGVIARCPFLMSRLAVHIIRHVTSGKLPWSIIGAAIRINIHTVGTGIHNFMGTEQVVNANNEPVTKCRLYSCIFKGAIKRNGQWEAVPMYAMNEKTWSEVYRERMVRAKSEDQQSTVESPASGLRN